MKLIYQYMAIFYSHQIIFIHYKSRIATAILDFNDNDKFRLERVKLLHYFQQKFTDNMGGLGEFRVRVLRTWIIKIEQEVFCSGDYMILYLTTTDI